MTIEVQRDLPRRIHIFILFFIFTNAAFAVKEIAVLDLKGKGITDIEASVLTDKLCSQLLSSGEFRIMEREQITSVLKEQGFQQSGCTSNECVVEVGQLIGVKEIVAGSVGKVGSTFLVTLKLVNVGTGEIMKSIDHSYKGSIDELLVSGMAEIADKFSGIQTSDIHTVVHTETDRQPMAENKAEFSVYPVIKKKPPLLAHWDFKTVKTGGFINLCDSSQIGEIFSVDATDSYVRFKDKNSYIKVPHTDRFVSLSGITIIARVKIESTSPLSGSGQTIIRKENCFVLGIGSGGKVGFWLNGGVWTGAWDFSEKTIDTHWHTVAGVWDGEVMYVFIDGAQDPKTMQFKPSLNSNANDIYIGKFIEGGYEEFSGSIDDIRLYTQAIPLSEIKKIHDTFSGQTK